MQTQGNVSVTALAAASPSLPARILGVLFSPRATYAAVAAKPRAFGVLAFIVLTGAIATFIFLSTEVGKNAMLDQQIEAMRSFGMQMNDQVISRMEQGAERAKYFGSISQALVMPLSCLIVSGLAFAVFNAMMGGDSTFKQVFAIVAHSGVVLTVSQLFGLPLAYARERMTSAANLAVFAPFLDENTFAARALGAIDLFWVWWILSLSIGLGVLYKRRTTPIATTLIAIYVVIGIVIAAIKTAVSGA